MKPSTVTAAHNELFQDLEDRVVFLALPDSDYTYISDYSDTKVKPVRWVVQLRSTTHPGLFRLVDLVTTKPNFQDVTDLIFDHLGHEWAIAGCSKPENDCGF